jgi:putative acetyltransferase
MKIRLAQDKDCAEMARLHRATIRHINSQNYPEDIIEIWSGRTNAKRFRDNARKCKRWVAVEKNKIIGFVDHGDDDELWGLYIHKNYVGKGVGSRLLKTAEDSLKKQGVEIIKIKSTITAKKFYEKHGYKVLKKALHQILDKKLGIYIMAKVMNGY